MKRKKKTPDKELHEIKNKKRLRPVRDKKQHVRLKRVKSRRKAKAAASLLLVGVVVLLFAFMGGDPNLNSVPKTYLTVCAELPDDGSTPMDHTGLENVGYMNYRLKKQPTWYSYSHTDVVSPDNQDVDTYKQFSNGILIQTDTAVDSMGLVHEAQQFCWILDEAEWEIGDFTDGIVMWRTTSKHKDTWSLGPDIPWDEWNERDYSFNRRSIEHFTYGCAEEGEEEPHKQEEVNGLPGTAFSVYVIREETLLSVSDVTDHGNGTYSQTFELRTESMSDADDSAVCHYRNQMVFKGGLDELPSFSAVSITYTFDATWRVLSSTAVEKYNAKKTIAVSCTGTNVTEYKYPEDPDVSPDLFTNPAYENYFIHQYDKDEVSKQLTATDCFTEAFGAILNQPASLQLSLDIDGYRLEGLICLDLSSMDIAAMDFSAIDVRAQFQNNVIRLYYTDNKAYLAYGGIKVKLDVGQLLPLFSGNAVSDEGASGEGGFSLDAVLGELIGEKDLEFYNDGRNAKFSTSLDLSGMISGLNISELNFDFNIGENNAVSLNYLEGKIELGGITISAEMSFSDQMLPALDSSEKEEYIELSPYVESIVKLMREDVLAVAVSYRNEKFGLEGTVDFSYRDEFAIVADFMLTYNGSKKPVVFAYLNDALYVNLDGVCVQANAEQVLKLAEWFPDLDLEKTIAELFGGLTEQIDFDLAGILEKVLSDSFDGIGVTEHNKQLSVAVKLTQILELFGIGFDSVEGLGNVTLDILQDGGITLNAFGAVVSLTKGESITFDTNGYVDVVPYVNEMMGIFSGEAIDISITYSSENLSVSGSVSVAIAGEMQVKGNLVLAYDDAVIPVGLYYADGKIYLDLLNFKAKSDIQTLTGALSGLQLGTPDSLLAVIQGLIAQQPFDFADFGSALEKIGAQLFNYCLGDLIGLSESEQALNIKLDGTNLLNMLLGYQLPVGDITLKIQKGVVDVNLFGKDLLRLTSGRAFEPVEDAENYIDVTELVTLVCDVLDKGSFALDGFVEITSGSEEETVLTLTIKDGVISWKNGFDAYFELLISTSGVEQSVFFRANKENIRIAYGSVGVDLIYEDFHVLDEAFVRLYNIVDGVIDDMIVQGSPMPEIESISELFALLKGYFASRDVLGAMNGTGGIGALLKQMQLTASAEGICKFICGNFTAELFGGEQGASLVLGYENDDLKLSADLAVAAYDCEANKIKDMPVGVSYLTVSDFAVLLDYVGASVQTIAQTNITVDLSAETVNAATQEKITSITGKLLYHTGEDVLIKIDTEEKTLTVTTDLYLNVSLQIVPHNSEVGTYLDVLVFDYNDDEELDFFVTLSKFQSKEADARYQPLKMYAPAGEIMTVLSAGLAVFGIDSDLLNQYMVSRWLQTETREELLAFGTMLKKSLGIGQGFGLMSGDGMVSGANQNVIRDAFLQSVTVGADTFTVNLNSNAIYGMENLEDVTFSVSKENGCLKNISLLNLYNRDAREKTNVSVGISVAEIGQDAMTAPTNLEGYFRLNGLSALLKTIVHTATHEVTDEKGNVSYVMNDNFYIDGTVNLNLKVIKLFDIALAVKVALSVDLDENGNVLVKAQLNYDGYGIMGQVAINGNTQLDLDIDVPNGMVYMKRLQTSVHNGWSNKALDANNYITEYRAMPLGIFFNDILNQLGFMMNFGTLITQYLPENLEGSGEKEVVDYGTELQSYLSNFVFEDKKENGFAWVFTLNGAALSGGTLKDIVISLGADSNMILKTLGINTEIDAGTGAVDVKLAGNLTLRNPKNVMENGVVDNVQDITADLKGAIGKAFQEAQEKDWKDENGKNIYISGVLTTVTYKVGDTTLSTQSVLYNGKTNELYAELKYPDLSEYQIEGYTLVWEDVGESITPNQVITANYVANLYEVRFVSTKQIKSDWLFDSATGLYYYDTQMYYGSEIELYEGDDQLVGTYIVSFKDNIFQLPDSESREWMQADIYRDYARFTSYGIPDKVTYISEIEFIYQGATYTSGYQKNFENDYTLFEADQISAQYQFLGWYMQTEDGWVNVENFVYSQGGQFEYVVEALWQKKAFTIDSVSGKRNKTGVWNYENAITMSVTEGELVGAWANDQALEKKTVYDYVISTATVGVKLEGQTEQTAFSHPNSFNIANSISVKGTVTYTLNGKTVYTVTTPEAKGSIGA